MTFVEVINLIIEQLNNLFDNRASDVELSIAPIDIGNDLVIHAKLIPVQCKTFVDWELCADVRHKNGDIERGWGYTSYSLGKFAKLKENEQGLKELLGPYFDHGKIVRKSRHYDVDERGFDYWETLVIYEDGYTEWTDFEKGDEF